MAPFSPGPVLPGTVLPVNVAPAPCNSARVPPPAPSPPPLADLRAARDARSRTAAPAGICHTSSPRAGVRRTAAAVPGCRTATAPPRQSPSPAAIGLPELPRRGARSGTRSAARAALPPESPGRRVCSPRRSSSWPPGAALSPQPSASHNSGRERCTRRRLLGFVPRTKSCPQSQYSADGGFSRWQCGQVIPRRPLCQIAARRRRKVDKVNNRSLTLSTNSPSGGRAEILIDCP